MFACCPWNCLVFHQVLNLKYICFRLLVTNDFIFFYSRTTTSWTPCSCLRMWYKESRCSLVCFFPPIAHMHISHKHSNTQTHCAATMHLTHSSNSTLKPGTWCGKGEERSFFLFLPRSFSCISQLVWIKRTVTDRRRASWVKFPSIQCFLCGFFFFDEATNELLVL